MSALYPVLLKLDGRRCVVIGGGWESDARVHALLEAGAAVRLVSPVYSAAMELLEREGRIEWRRREYAPGDLDGAFLAVSCPPDRAINASIWVEAEARGIPLNAIDDPQHCSFLFPAIHRQGDLVVAVSSSGKSPALAARVRDRVAEQIGPEFGEFLDLLGEVRPEVIERFPGFDSRRRIWYALVDSGALEHLRAGDREGARAAIAAIARST